MHSRQDFTIDIWSTKGTKGEPTEHEMGTHYASSKLRTRYAEMPIKEKEYQESGDCWGVGEAKPYAGAKFGPRPPRMPSRPSSKPSTTPSRDFPSRD